MARILYLAHRLPFPPDKGDKVRSHHILRELSNHHTVRLGTFVDDPGDLQHLGAVEQLCGELFVRQLVPLQARLRALIGLCGGRPLTLAYYHDRLLRAWVLDLAARGLFDAAVVSSSSMAPYVAGLDLPVFMDFIDVDSLKWRAYADSTSGPARWLFRREFRTLVRFEQQVAMQAQGSFFVSQREAALFRGLSPGLHADVEVLENGVDAEYFMPLAGRQSPYPADELPIAFSGTMSYRPNVDAVIWFSEGVMPLLRKRWPRLRLTVVGRNPVTAVRRLGGVQTRVTGTVSDVRPWLQHASVVVAPMRIARGVQNKVLEAMAMARPVVTSVDCASALDVISGRHLLAASGEAEFASAVETLLADRLLARQLGESARSRVRERYTWNASLAPLRRALARLEPTRT